MTQVTHDNHFVPQLYLKQWSSDGKKVWAYHTLVSNEKVPNWENRPIRGVAFHRDLYTSFSDGHEIDEFERWIEAEFEAPANEVLKKVLHNKNLTSSDWEKLAMFLAAQDVRTPTSYLESMRRWKDTIPKLFEKVLKESVQRLEQSSQTERASLYSHISQQFFQKAIKVKVERNAEADGGFISASVVVGRALWLDSQRYLLTKSAKILLNHKWSIVEPSNGTEWYTSDHPVVRLNYYGHNNYDLKGGWNNPGTNLIMPLSPRHLLFTQISTDIPDRFTFSPSQTILIQRVISERALRWIYARKRMNRVLEYRPRRVDATTYREEEEQIRKWHEEQSKAELDDRLDNK